MQFLFNKNNIDYTKKDSAKAIMLSIFLPLVLVFFLLFILLIISSLFSIHTNSVVIANSNLFKISIMFIPPLSFFAIYRYITVSRVKGQSNYIIDKKLKFFDVLIAIIIPLIAILFLYPLIQLLEYGISSFIDIPSIDLPIPFKGFGNYLLLVLVACFLPAIGEELLFRKTIFSGLLSLGYRKAIILSAIVFALIHMSIYQTIYQFILGLILAYVFYVSKNITVPIIMHFVNNFIIITTIFVSQDAISEVAIEYSYESVYDYASPIITSIIGSIIIGIVLYKYKTLKTQKNPDILEQRMIENKKYNKKLKTLEIRHEMGLVELNDGFAKEETFSEEKSNIQFVQQGNMLLFTSFIALILIWVTSLLVQILS